MNLTELERLLRGLRLHIRLIRAIRVLFLAATAGAVLWAVRLPGPDDKRAMFAIFMATLVSWMIMMLNSARLGRYVRTATALLGLGHLDDAEVWLRRALERFSMSARTKIIAAQQLASLLFRRDEHAKVVVVCRGLLRERLFHLQHVWVNTRLMLADSLLMLGHVAEAYEAIRPVYDAPLSLAERMKLLPIQLRYELAAEYPAAAVQALPEKLQIAELLDSPRAALVHALLAEACRRSNLAEQQAFLAERAWLYHDLDQLAIRYPVIAAIAASRPAQA
jgi:hypothetical protein